MRVIVVGGGIMGLSTALYLCRQGHKVTLFEQSGIPNDAGSSVDAHRLIRHPYGPMKGYARLVNPALAAWSRLWDELGQSFFYETGTLILARDDLEWVNASLSDMMELGIEHAVVGRQEIEERLPMLKTDGVEIAAWVKSGGVLLAKEIVQAMARQVVLRGGTVNTHTPIVDVDTQRASVTTEDGSRVRGDRLVIAAGPWVRDLCPSAVGRVKPSRQLVVYLRPPSDIIERWQRSPMILDIHGKGGIYVVPPVGGTGLKIGDHSFSLKGHPSNPRTFKERELEALMEASNHRLANLDTYETLHGKVCFYTVQPDERFILEPVDKALLMTGFSGHGFKFGALMGAIASGVLTGRIGTDDAASIAAGRTEDTEAITSLTNLCLD